jgi:hypothetical protein
MGIWEGLLLTLAGALGLVIVFAIRAGRDWIIDKLGELSARLPDNQVKSIAIDTAMDIIRHIAEVTVGEIEQLTAKDLRQAVKEGKTSRDELLKLGEEAYYKILSRAAPEVIEALEGAVLDTEGYIKALIEQNVLAAKMIS